MQRTQRVTTGCCDNKMVIKVDGIINYGLVDVL